MTYPPVVIVDAKDRVVDWAPLGDAWAKGLIHRLVYVIVEDGQGRVMLHKRAPGMLLYPGCWDTIAGHVDVTPDYEESARIELREEGGIDDAELEEVAYFYSEAPYHDGKYPKRFIKIYRTVCGAQTARPEDHEVSETRWFTKKDLLELKNSAPEKFAFGLELCLPYIIDGYEDYQHQAAGQAERPLLHIC